ncbi:MAG: N-acetyl-gamma-glutamyl-phosphate reductase [Lysobacterales bacterium]
MPITASILGASGYGGGELYRWLLQHPRVERIQGVAHSQAGVAVAKVHPQLRGLVDGPFAAEVDWAALAASEQPVLFAALPHGEFARRYGDLTEEIAANGLNDRLTIIDLSGDFRLRDPAAFALAYGGEHPCPQYLDDFVYGLADWQPARLQGARRIANPGCFATAVALGLLWLAALPASLRPKPVAVSAITGSSGSGIKPSETTHHPARAHDFRAYKPLQHQHRFEVSAAAVAAGWQPDWSLVTHSAPLVRGIHATLQFPAGAITAADLDQACAQAFGDQRFVRRVDAPPRLAAVNGSNFVDIGAALADGHGTVLVALDNLGKGMASQAIQNMNLALGLPADLGLRVAAPIPG